MKSEEGPNALPNPTELLDKLVQATERLLSSSPQAAAAEILQIGQEVLGASAVLLFSMDLRQAGPRANLKVAAAGTLDLDAAIALASALAPQPGDAAKLIEKIESQEDMADSRDYFLKRGLAAALFLPLGREALLALYYDSPRKFSGEYVSLVRLFANCALMALERKNIAGKISDTESLLYDIAHDLKGPLVSMAGFAALLHKEYGDALKEEGKAYTEKIMLNAGRMQKMVQALLEFLRARPEKMEEVDSGRLIRSALHRLQPQIKQRGVQVVVQPKLPQLVADPDKLIEVFLKLLDNAISYGQRNLRIEIGCRQEPEAWYFYVRDNGPGVHPEYHEKIFELFQRPPEAGKLNPQGIGAGLALVRRIVEEHGGRAWVESAPGQGSSFWISLPKRKADESRGDKPTTA